MIRTLPVETVRTMRFPLSSRYTSMRSAYCVELFWLATTLPVKTTSPSFCRFSSWSASTVTGALRPSWLAAGRARSAPTPPSTASPPTTARPRPARNSSSRNWVSWAPGSDRLGGRAALEGGAHSPPDTGRLFGDPRLEAGAAHDGVRPIDGHRLVRPRALRLRVPAEPLRLEPQAVARDQHHVAPELHVLGLLVQIALVPGDRPRARAAGALGRLVHLDRHLLHRRRVLLLEGLGVLGVELPAGAIPTRFLKANLLEPVIRVRGRGLGGNRPRRPCPVDEHAHHHG